MFGPHIHSNKELLVGAITGGSRPGGDLNDVRGDLGGPGAAFLVHVEAEREMRVINGVFRYRFLRTESNLNELTSCSEQTVKRKTRWLHRCWPMANSGRNLFSGTFRWLRQPNGVADVG